MASRMREASGIAENFFSHSISICADVAVNPRGGTVSVRAGSKTVPPSVASREMESVFMFFQLVAHGISHAEVTSGIELDVRENQFVQA